MKRREFFNWVGIGLLASYFPVALAACSETSSQSNSSSSTEEFLSIGTTKQLEETGYLLDEKFDVIVLQNSNNQPIAFNSLCTHLGCAVEWRQSSSSLFCPCHNSEFALDGKVLAGPAKEPLSTYEVKEENGEILVKVG